ncbi:serine/threonine-protein kinase Sgk1-like [Centruroides sculpturatus]|uniref:serine/threonine-protein kinase Sgk1-like n=1 Tax=Centruroides sculpturatus TaxID=218467 RepID=UPI000C6DA319|nr:serine/threonine-protein kinase Sgk1-like [Centruroides sculpturatus]
MMRSVRKMFLRMLSSKEKRKMREDNAEPDGQRDREYPIKIDENLHGTKCLPVEKEDSQFHGKKQKKTGKFIEFCRNVFYKFCCCHCNTAEISDSQNCQSEDSQFGVDSSKMNKDIINDYEFQEIGKGAFGTVYLARCGNSDQNVALKVVERKRFCLAQRRELNKERKAWATVSSHPHIVSLICFFKTNTSFCFVSDFVDGQDITHSLENDGPFEEARVKMIGAQVASAIMYIHDRGIIHRDIGSNNVMIDKSKGAQLIDFGLCTYEQNPNKSCGTLFYLCPEILEGKPYDAYCDWWAFGILLYQMLIGKTPMEMYLEKVPNIDNMSFMEIIKSKR